MDARAQSFDVIFRRDVRYVVPVFQRRYAWERERQWEPFWGDVLEVVEAYVDAAEAGGTAPRGDELPVHFLGAIVVKLVPFGAGQLELREVIDALVRRVRVAAERWPWEWKVEDLEEFFSDLASAPDLRRPATLRNYQSQLRGFLAFIVDERYSWRLICTGCFDRVLTQLLDEHNLIVHVSDSECDPRRRALTRDELDAFFDSCDRRVAGRRALRRKGSLAALRDGALFKVAYGWGLRRTELIGLDLCDLLANPRQPRFGTYGIVRVRHGKGSRGSAPKRRDVLTVWPWAAEVLEQYVTEIRPLFGFDNQPALWLTERGGRMSGRHVDERFAEVRDDLEMDRAHTPHALRHSYITHLHEENFDALFVKEQVGHRYMSTTALYTAVSSDYKQRALAAAIDGQLIEMGGL